MWPTAPSRVRASLAPLESPSALSWPVLLVFCPLIAVVQAVMNRGFEGGAFLPWLLAAAIGMVALSMVIVAARWLACRRGDPRLGVVLGTYVLATFVETMVLAAAARELGLLSGLQWGYRFSGAVLALAPLLALVGFAVSTHAAHRRVVADLQQKRARLLERGPSLDAELDRLQAELAGAVRASLEPALAALDASLSAAARGGGDAAALDALDAIVDDHLRPVSRELVAAGTEPGAGDIAAAAGVPARVPLPKRFIVAAGMQPALAAMALVVVAIPTAARHLTGWALPAYLLVLGVVFGAGLWLAHRALGRWAAPTPVGVAVIIVVHLVASTAAFAVMPIVGIPRPPGIAVVAVTLAGMIGALIAASVLVSERRAETEAELAAATDRLERVVAFTLRRQRLVRRRLAFVLHGSLQGALYAAALRVGEGARVDSTLVDEVRTDVAAALVKLEAPGAPVGTCRTRVAIDDLVEIWRGRRAVVAQMPQHVDAALRRDDDADQASAEVVREAVNNAFRHGGAAMVHVEVTFAAAAAAVGHPGVSIVVRDDGRGPSRDITPGLGTVLFDDVCRGWDYSTVGGESTFRAEIELAFRSGIEVV